MTRSRSTPARGLRVDLLIPQMRLGPVAVDVSSVGGVRLRDILGPVLAGPSTREGDVTVWPLALPEGVEVGLTLPLLGTLNVGAEDGAVVLQMPRKLWASLVAVADVPTRSVTRIGNAVRVSVEPTVIDRIQLPLPVVGTLGLRAGS